MEDFIVWIWDVIVIGIGIGGGSVGCLLVEWGLFVLFVEKGIDLGDSWIEGLVIDIVDFVVCVVNGVWLCLINVEFDGMIY